MLELIVCSMVTILPDYLYRRYVQGKRFGSEITLLFGLVRAALGDHRLPDPDGLLITMIFYFHPSTTNAVSSSAPYRSCRRRAAGWRRSMSRSIATR